MLPGDRVVEAEATSPVADTVAVREEVRVATAEARRARTAEASSGRESDACDMPSPGQPTSN